MPVQANLETILRPGQLVGAQYRVDRLIAKGGMAAVWAGVNEHTGKRVALKVILQSFASNGNAIELFRREALSASKVNHPNVVNIFDVIDHGGMTCIVMELFDGETLASYLARNGPLSLEKTLAILLPAMRGVAAANAQGVVHRDLKPANIFLCSSPEGQLITAKVLDFGISVMMRRAGDIAPAPEQLAMFGTPAYMAPEAIEFSPNIDGRADVYGFGVLFFEALTGKLPFPGYPGLELLKRILTEPAPAATLYRPDLPSDVVNFIACALAKKPGDRFADMDHLVRATEDRLLPLLPAPRSSTPISGILLLPLAESNPDVPIPLVKAASEKKPSSLVHLSQTRVLYSMASEPSRAASGAGIAQSRTISPTVTGTSNPRRTLNRRAAMGAAMVVFSLVTAWATVPASSSSKRATQGQSSTSSKITTVAPGSLVIPLPSTPSPEPPPVIITDEANEPIADSGGAPATIHTIERWPTSRSIRTTVPHPSWRAFRRDSIASQPRAVSSARPAAPRAGRLSASDF